MRRASDPARPPSPRRRTPATSTGVFGRYPPVLHARNAGAGLFGRRLGSSSHITQGCDLRQGSGSALAIMRVIAPLKVASRAVTEHSRWGKCDRIRRTERKVGTRARTILVKSVGSPFRPCTNRTGTFFPGFGRPAGAAVAGRADAAVIPTGFGDGGAARPNATMSIDRSSGEVACGLFGTRCGTGSASSNFVPASRSRFHCPATKRPLNWFRWPAVIPACPSPPSRHHRHPDGQRDPGSRSRDVAVRVGPP